MADSEKSSRYNLIIFDLDGTLIDSMGYHVRAFKKVLGKERINLKDPEVMKMIGYPSEVILGKLKKKYHLKDNVDSMRKLRRVYLAQSLEGKTILFPGVMKTLVRLKKEYRLAVATGSSRASLDILTNKRFRKNFNSIVTIDNVKNGKPSPEELFYASRKLGVNPKKCLVVGDSIYDAIAARRAGMDFIGVTTGFYKKSRLGKEGAVEVLKSIKDLNKYL